MAISDEAVEKPSSEGDKSSKEPLKNKEKKEKPLTKIIIRRLPPTMDQESFINQVSPLPDYDYMYTVKGDLSLGEHAFSRVYINFVNASDVFLFREKFDNYVFVDQKGHEYAAVVEFATFQKIPRKRKPRPDPKSATIESDSYYLEFLESLKEQPNQEEKPEYSYQFEGKEEVATTPLLDFIKQKRLDKQRIREERREERRRRELERKKLREDERKRHEVKSPRSVKPAGGRKALDSVKEEVNEKFEKETEEKSYTSSYKEKKYEKNYYKSKRYSDKYDYDVKEYKKNDYREKEYRNRRYDDYKKDDVKEMPRKTKKYSEKREERKLEAQKKEAEKSELESSQNTDEKAKKSDELEKAEEPKESDDVQTSNEIKNSESIIKEELKCEEDKNGDSAVDDYELKLRSKDDPRMQRRIRNKDRPAMQIYQPGMLSKRKTNDGTDNGSSQSGNKD